MLINWFRDQDHLVYINGETQLAQLEKTLRFPGLQEAAEALRDDPNPEGLFCNLYFCTYKRNK